MQLYQKHWTFHHTVRSIPQFISTLGIILLFMEPAQVKAQSAPQLEQFIHEALTNNPRLRASKARVQAAEARIPQAAAWDDPVFGFEFYSTPITSLNPLKDGLENDYSLQQMIPFPGKKRLMEEMSVYGVRMAEQDAVTSERALAAIVIASYGMIRAAQQRLMIVRENQAQLSELISSSQARYSTGQETIADVLRMKVELENLKNEEISIEQELRSSKAMLNALRGAPADTAIGVLESLPLIPPPSTFDSLVTAAIENRSELRSMTFDRSMAETEVATWQRERYPDFMIRVMYKEMRFDMPDSWSLMFGISIPIAPWASGKYSGHIEEARAKQQAATETIANMRNMVVAEVQDAWAKALSIWRQLERTRNVIIPISEQAFQSILSQYQVAQTNFISLIDAWRMVTMAKMNAAMLEGEYAGAQAQMQRAAGTLY